MNMKDGECWVGSRCIYMLCLARCSITSESSSCSVGELIVAERCDGLQHSQLLRGGNSHSRVFHRTSQLCPGLIIANTRRVRIYNTTIRNHIGTGNRCQEYKLCRTKRAAEGQIAK